MAPSRALRIPLDACAQCAKQYTQRRGFAAVAPRSYADGSRLPRIANPSFWASLVPSFLRRSTDAQQAEERARRRGTGADERRTGIAFLILGILVGSNAINIISIRRDMLNFSRQTDAKLETLREVIQRVKSGEDFDVKKALGTGDPDQEKEWEQVIQELQNTDMLWEGRKKRDAKRAEKAEERRLKDEEKKQAREAGGPTSEPSGQANTSRPKFLM
ncbi:hypothetical protein M409DRAFT_71400 [Zasmidium cellare ATCC 36951]|uniref:Uncharacterized protein n=1 Tax=Zasmidium cellare ATCC 36951 TaxID=1080233 RepID=A0A6A6BZ97_ZASCE|nr:uncharacterized protein M409DRAFT_71400 [Zasmidium cellare ATCC 36951]KAF2158922.1 hypothetical protein M409DRAFT_71400 [Zasmidium cellare ATCC 36951]